MSEVADLERVEDISSDLGDRLNWATAIGRPARAKIRRLRC